MARTCHYCGEGTTKDEGTPAYYDELDDYAHVDCAHAHGVSD